MDLLQYFIVCPLVFLAGFIDAIAGGGGLISLPAYLIAGLPPHFAIGTNKMSSTLGTVVATAKYALNGYIHWRHVLVCVPAALIGASLGSNLALLVPDDVFLVILIVLLPLIALYVLRRKSLTSDLPTHSRLKESLLLIGISLVIGMYDGFYGPGTGTFLMLVLTGVAHVSLHDAAGITKAVNLTSNVVALSVFLWNGVVWIQLGLVAALFSIFGNYLGARYFTKDGARIVRPVILFVLSIFFIKIIYDLVQAYV